MMPDTVYFFNPCVQRQQIFEVLYSQVIQIIIGARENFLDITTINSLNALERHMLSRLEN